MKIHPVADLFPMLADDELRELADDIKARGQLQPIVLDPSGAVLDGRNRLAACKLAGVEPEFVTYEGEDADGYAVAVNIARRHLTKGQKAMVAVEARLLKNNNLTQEELAGEIGNLSQSYIAQAFMVHKFAPDLVPLIISGVMPLSEGYAESRDRKKRAAEKERIQKRLAAEGPDLAFRVEDENDKLTLEEAITLLDSRVSEEKRKAEEERAEARRQAQVQTHQIQDIIVTLSQMRGFSPGEKYDPSLAIPGRPVNREVLDQADQALGELIEIWEKRGLE